MRQPTRCNKQRYLEGQNLVTRKNTYRSRQTQRKSEKKAKVATIKMVHTYCVKFMILYIFLVSFSKRRGYWFSGSSDTNHGSLMQNTTYTGPPRLRSLFQVVQTQTYSLLNTIYTGPPHLRGLFQVVQTQTTTAYCRILPTLDHRVCLRYVFQVLQTQTTTTYCRILGSILCHHNEDIFTEFKIQTTAAYCRILPTLGHHHI